MDDTEIYEQTRDFEDDCYEADEELRSELSEFYDELLNNYNFLKNKIDNLPDEAMDEAQRILDNSYLADVLSVIHSVKF